MSENSPAWELADLHIREVLAIELKHRDLALENQAAEYERRLEILNNENQRILAAGARSVSLEKYEANQAAIGEWKDRIDKFVNSTEASNRALAAAQVRLRAMVAVWIALASVIVTLVMLLTR